MRLPLVRDEAQATSIKATRSCGDCTICCIVPQIPDEPGSILPNGKEFNTHCEHLHDTSGCVGCTQYNNRPQICRDFLCLWRAGVIEGDERRRPDNLKVMFTTNEINGDGYLEAWETKPDVFLHHPARGVIDAIAQRAPLLVRFYGVPCSMVYKGPVTLAKGYELQQMALNNPPVLAAWIREQVDNRAMHLDERGQASFDRAMTNLERSK